MYMGSCVWLQVLYGIWLLFVCRTNTNVNDALGDYSLTLVDSLDTLVVSVGFVKWASVVHLTRS